MRSVAEFAKLEAVAHNRTFYTDSEGVQIAYRLLGEGEIDVLCYPGAPLLPMESIDDEPNYERFQNRLASFCRLIQFDARGVGLSERTPPSSPPTLEQWVQDSLAVLDAVGCGEVAVLAPRDATLEAVLLATSHPERVARLVLINGFPRIREAPDYPVGVPNKDIDRFLEVNTDPARGSADSLTDPFLSRAAPSVASDPAFRQWWERAGRQGASPATARAILAVLYDADVRPLLGLVQAPTLILHRRDVIVLTVGHGRFMAENIPGARYVELAGDDSLFWVGDTNQMLEEIEVFLTGAPHRAVADRILASVLFTDIVRSTESLAKVGDRLWREMLDRHDALARRELERFRGRQVKTTGDGLLAVFDGPARAVLCACAIRSGASRLGLQVRAGVHTGEVEVRGDDIAGMAVHIAARIEALASPEQVLVSRTVVDLVVGSGIAFEDHGEQELKGVPGTWRLFAVEG